MNREGFMVILTNLWETWASKETVVSAGKRVGIFNKVECKLDAARQV